MVQRSRISAFKISIALPLALSLILAWQAIDVILYGDLAHALTTPTSQITTEEQFDAQSVKKNSIQKIEFLNIKGSDNIGYSDQVIARVLEHPEFKKQLAQLEKKNTNGAALPPPHVLAGLFIMGSLGLGGRVSRRNGKEYAYADIGKKLTDFFRFEKVKKVLTKTINVVRKVPVYTKRVVKDVITRVVKVPRKIPYTAYQTVKNVSYKTRKWTETVIKPKWQHPIDRMTRIAKFMQDNYRKHLRSFSRRFRRNARYNLKDPRRYSGMKKMFNLVQSGRRIGRFAYRFRKNVSRVGRNLQSTVGKFFSGLRWQSPELHKKLLKEFRAIAYPTYAKRVVKTAKDRVVTYTKKAYTAYRTVYDRVEKKIERVRTYRDVSYKEVTEQKEVKETYEEVKATPIRTKIALALNYVKNLGRMTKTPGNRALRNALRSMHHGPFGSDYKQFKNIKSAVGRAHRANDFNAPAVQHYNAFLINLKEKALKIRESEDPMKAMFGSRYYYDVIQPERNINSRKIKEKEFLAKKHEISILYRQNKISKSYYRSMYDRYKKKARQEHRGHKRAIDRLKKQKSWYRRKYNSMMSAIDTSVYLKDTRTYSETLRATDPYIGSIGTVPVVLTKSGRYDVHPAYKNVKNPSVFIARPKQTLRRAKVNVGNTNILASLTATPKQPSNLKKADLGISWDWKKPWSISTNNTRYNQELQAKTAQAKLEVLKRPPYEGPMTQKEMEAYEKRLAAYEKEYNATIKILKKNAPKTGVIAHAGSFLDGFTSAVWREIKGLRAFLDWETYWALVKGVGKLITALYKVGKHVVINGTETLDYIAAAFKQDLGVVGENIEKALVAAKTAIQNINDSASARRAGDLTGVLAFNFIPIGRITKADDVPKVINGVSDTINRGINDMLTAKSTTRKTTSLISAAEGQRIISNLHRVTLSVDIVQPVSSLNRIITLSRAAKPGFDASLTKIASQTAGTAKLTALKTDTIEGYVRAQQKIVDDYNGKAAQLTDVLRGSLVFDKYSDLKKSISVIEKEFKILKLKDNFSHPRRGYRDVNLLVQNKNGVVSEIQLHLKPIYEVKYNHADEFYRQIRGLESQLDSTKGVMKENQLAERIDDLKKKEEMLFDTAWNISNKN